MQQHQITSGGDCIYYTRWVHELLRSKELSRKFRLFYAICDCILFVKQHSFCQSKEEVVVTMEENRGETGFVQKGDSYEATKLQTGEGIFSLF